MSEFAYGKFPKPVNLFIIFGTIVFTLFGGTILRKCFSVIVCDVLLEMCELNWLSTTKLSILNKKNN